MRDPEATIAVLQHAHAAFGDIDVLVSGAAGNFPAAASDMSPNAFGSVVNIDLLGSFHVLRAAYRLLRKPGAVIINVPAPQAFLPMALQSHVCAAKAGVDMLTRVLAIEWGDAGIRVNAVVPGTGWPRQRPTTGIRQSPRTTVDRPVPGPCRCLYGNASAVGAVLRQELRSGDEHRAGRPPFRRSANRP